MYLAPVRTLHDHSDCFRLARLQSGMRRLGKDGAIDSPGAYPNYFTMNEEPVLIIDDHDIFRSGLRLLLVNRLKIKAVEEARSLDETLAYMSQGPTPRLVTLDLRMPGVAGPEAIAALKEGWPDVPIVIISVSEHREDILACLAAGAFGYCPKSLSADETVDALKQVLKGQIYVPKVLHSPQQQVRAAGAAAFDVNRLTERQRQVLEALRTGATSKEIGRQLDLAEGTVKIHLAGIYRALGVKTRAEAIAKLK